MCASNSEVSASGIGQVIGTGLPFNVHGEELPFAGAYAVEEDNAPEDRVFANA